MKIIPAIDLMDGKVVRLYKGDPKNKTIYSDNPIETAKKWESAGADILHIVDLDATLGSGQNLKTIQEISKNVYYSYLLSSSLETYVEYENKIKSAIAQEMNEEYIAELEKESQYFSGLLDLALSVNVGPDGDEVQ